MLGSSTYPTMPAVVLHAMYMIVLRRPMPSHSVPPEYCIATNSPSRTSHAVKLPSENVSLPDTCTTFTYRLMVYVALVPPNVVPVPVYVLPTAAA